MATPIVNDPKIGYELECRKICWVNPDAGPASNVPVVKATKGKPFAFKDLENRPDWKVTAETMQANLHKLTTEIVVDGGEKTNKRGVSLLTGENVGERVGNEILEFITQLTQNWSKGGEFTQARILNSGLEEYAWDLSVMGGGVPTPEQLTWGLQVTAAFPLAALCDIVPEKPTHQPGQTRQTKPDTALVDQAKFEIVPSFFFPQHNAENPWTDAEIGDDVRGYVSLLVAYIKTSKSGNARAGPKHSTSIMPRTDFKSMYHHTVKPKIEEILAEMTQSDNWWNVTASSATGPYKGAKITDFTSWIYAICRRMEVCDSYDNFARMQIPWDGGLEKDEHSQRMVPVVVGPMVKAWLDDIVANDTGIDLVSTQDLGRNGQIGGLRNVFERSIVGDKICPIFEFRDLSGRTTEKIPAWLGGLEEELRGHHAKHGKA